MKAAIVTEPGRIVVEEIPVPTPGEYQVLCRLLFGATCSGTDLHLIDNKMPRPIIYPTVLGHESIGQVVSMGPRVRHLREGDLVTRVGTLAMPGIGLHVNWGGFCEFGIATDHRAMRDDGVPRSQWTKTRINQVIPTDFDAAAATMIITWRETLSYIRRMGVCAGRRVLILGTGGTGLAFATHARNLGAEPTVVGSPARQPAASAAGAAHFFDYSTPDLQGMIASAAIGPFDFIIDAVGKTGQVNRILPLLAAGGVVAIYGIDDYGNCSVNPTRAAGSFTIHQGGYDEEETHAEVISRISDGSLDARIWLNLEKPFALDEIAHAFEAVRSRREIKALVRLAEH